VTPAVAENTVYLGSCSGVYYAFDMETGSIRWSYDFKPEVGQLTFHGDPLLTGDLLITGGEAVDPPQMRAFERSTGQLAWKREGEWALTRSDVTGVGDLAVGRNARGELVALDSRTGELVWHVPHQGERYRMDVAESPAAAGSRIVFSAPDGALYQVDAESGRVGWRTPIDCDASTSVAVESDDVYVGCDDGRLFLISALTGQARSSLSLGHPLEGRLLLMPDRLIVPSGRRWITAVDRELSAILWERADWSELSVVQPLLWRDALLTGTADGELLALSPDDGRTLWSTRLDGQIRGLGKHGDILIVGTVQGKLYVLRAVR
jgi:outer membrane protein assembly factor BamB